MRSDEVQLEIVRSLNFRDPIDEGDMSLTQTAVRVDPSASRPLPSKLLRLLLVEDSDEDAVRIIVALKRTGFDPVCTRVDTREAFQRALESRTWDAIISAHSLREFSGLAALADARATGRDIPFILVSDTVDEAVAASAIRLGAHDYVLRGDTVRLPIAVDRELREAATRADRVNLRERIVMLERLASAGMVAAGVAHEINNPLAIAMVNLDLTADALTRVVRLAASKASASRENPDASRPTGPGARLASALEADGGHPGTTMRDELHGLEESLADAREALQRVADIVRDVKVFSRADDEAALTVDLRRVADSSARMANNEIRHRARLVKRYGEVPLVAASESRLGQVVLNLLVNAAHAMPEGRADQNEIGITTRTRDDGWAVLEVADTGSGIAPEHLARIFDPFFTTKAVGVGMGLGLAICHRIVGELGGRIEVDSTVGKGSVFRLALPAAREGGHSPKTTTRRPNGVRGRVLVVDDELALGRALGRGLGAHHDVKVVTSGTEACQLIANGGSFDVILLDLMMPHMSGMEVHARLEQIAPEQASRIIFVTGGAFTAQARAFLDRVPNPKLDKPVDLSEVLELIERRVGRG
jgi:signal transduction histidine kinase